MTINTNTGIADALQQAGNQAHLAERLGVSQQAVSIWLRRGWVPVRRALEIEAQFGVPRARLISPRLADLVDLPEGGQ
jgi:DNA-binding transcriptional regulator YdaS (Cro superfamily)